MDFDFTGFGAPAELRDALAEAFVRRTAPGAGLTSLHSMKQVYGAAVRFDRYLAGLRWPPATVAQVQPEHLDAFGESRRIRRSTQEVQLVLRLLAQAEGVNERLAARIAAPLPRRAPAERKQGYSRKEFRSIAEAARADIRAAAQRIRAHCEELESFRSGPLPAQSDVRRGQRLKLLEHADRFADVPREPIAGRKRPGAVAAQRWVKQHGKVKQIISWLHMTAEETAAAAVLLAIMTGENPQVILTAPAVHHRADGYVGTPGTALVSVRKPRRGRRAHMTLALEEIPDWISVPDGDRAVSTRDELHTPFGLYVLLHELTARSRQVLGGDRLLVGYGESGGSGTGRGLRALPTAGSQISRCGKAWGLLADEPDEKGHPAILPVRLDLLRLTYLELHQKPVAHTDRTLASTYLARNKGSITQYRKVVAEALAEQLARARARGTVVLMAPEDVERARAHPETVAAEQGLDAQVLKHMIDGDLDTVVAACSDNTGGTHGPAGEPCPASFLMCLQCPCARALPRHLPIQALVHDALAERRQQLDALRWAERFAAPHARLADVLRQHGDWAVQQAREQATAADRALVERFLNRELDLR
ncbi:hypothetical protein ADK70_31995 [Streptomyces rimosus subsp. pseudoverticillatus]|uniref:hypothetical protein n=1 Tax=Streptomyces rimosus TaxID=1927 RepID=UPI0006C14DFA|nr:hypothetical protein [Streptomyces rimosus]KOT79140.1 hypothetical protein ADK70_31995 [Streptomyces rimosus subsp. pseudoverticillatus]